jgi:cell division septation protein DedD
MAPITVKAAALTGVLALLSACQDGQSFFSRKSDAEGETAGAGDGNSAQSVRLVERDVEAPDVFQLTDGGLWDGRPSLGGVWVAHADVRDPERVIIRNTANDKFVIGALFRRERDNPGPPIQVSSDAAEALGMLAGQPAQLNVVALRRDEVAETPDPAPAEAPIETADEIEALPLDQPDEAVAAAPERPAEIAAAATAPLAAAPDAAATRAAPAASTPSNAFVQIGIFSVEANANNTATALRGAGMIPTVRTQTASGKTFYRVVVGPASSASEKTALLGKVKGLGFNDAYFTSN